MESPCHRGVELLPRSREVKVGKNKELKTVPYFICPAGGCRKEYSESEASAALEDQKKSLASRQSYPSKGL